jgi:hypothetical protein
MSIFGKIPSESSVLSSTRNPAFAECSAGNVHFAPLADFDEEERFLFGRGFYASCKLEVFAKAREISGRGSAGACSCRLLLRSARIDLQFALNAPRDIPPGRQQRAAASDAGEKVASRTGVLAQ